MMQELARLTGLDSVTMDGIARDKEAVASPPTTLVETPQSASPRAPEPLQRPPRKSLVEKSPIRSALATLLLYPQLANLVPELEELRTIDSIEGQLLLEMLELLKREPETRTHTLVGSWLNTDKHDYATRLLGFEDLLVDENKARQEFIDALQRIRRDLERQLLEQEWLRLGQLESMDPEQKARYKEVLTALQANSRYR
jgi:DNA primase